MKLGHIGILPDGSRIFVAIDEAPPPFVEMTLEPAWLDDNHVAHLGDPPIDCRMPDCQLSQIKHSHSQPNCSYSDLPKPSNKGGKP